jgi:hypothetical protein
VKYHHYWRPGRELNAEAAVLYLGDQWRSGPEGILAADRDAAAAGWQVVMFATRILLMSRTLTPPPFPAAKAGP